MLLSEVRFSYLIMPQSAALWYVRSFEFTDILEFVYSFFMGPGPNVCFNVQGHGFTSWPCLMSGRIPRHQARQRQSVVPAGVRASRVCKSVAAIRISGDFKPSPVRMAKRHFTVRPECQKIKIIWIPSDLLCEITLLGRKA